MAKKVQTIKSVTPEETQAKKDSILAGYKMSLTKKADALKRTENKRLNNYIALGQELNKLKADLKGFKLEKGTLENLYTDCGIASATARLARKLADNIEKIGDCDSLADARKIIYPPRTPKPEDTEETEETGEETEDKKALKVLTPEQHKIRALDHILKIDDKDILQDLIAEINKKIGK